MKKKFQTKFNKDYEMTSFKYKSLLLLGLLVLTHCGQKKSNNESDNKGDIKEGLHADGGTWGVKLSEKTDENDSIYILLIGDSILGGYRKQVAENLEGLSVDTWMTGKHLNSDGLIDELKAVITQRKYVVIHFNIGLHGWQKGRIPEGQYVPLLENYVRTLREFAPQAKLIWASTTPVTEEGTPILNKEINPTIIERNALAAEVMKKNGVVVNDLYTVVVNRLDLARLDRFHWNAAGYQIMANQILENIKKSNETYNNSY